MLPVRACGFESHFPHHLNQKSVAKSKKFQILLDNLPTFKYATAMNNKSRQTIIHEATKHGYVNQAILFNAGFSFQEVQKIKDKF